MKQKPAHHFTVSQLIEILKTFPQDLPVLTSGYENGFENIQHPEIMAMKYEPENAYYKGEFQTVKIDAKEACKTVVLRRVMRNE